MTSLANLQIPAGRAIASIFLLPDCDMACRFCISDRNFETLNLEEASSLLETLAVKGIFNVILGGGEPLLWRGGLDALLRWGKSLGLLMQICTSGLHLPADPGAWPVADRIILPLEAVDPGLHDALRQFPGGHHRLVMDHLEALTGTRKWVTLSTVVTRENMAELPRLGDYLAGMAARGLRIHAWHLYRFIPAGWAGGPNGSQLDLPVSDYRAAVDAQKARGLPFPVLRRSDLRHSSSVVYLWKQQGGWRSAC